MTYSIGTSRAGEEISSLLTKSYAWDVPRLGEPLNRQTMLESFDAIALANLEVEGSLDETFNTAHRTSVDFVQNAFDVFEGKAETPQFDWAFAVPARGGEDQAGEYASEVTFFLPILDPKFGVNALIRQRTVAHLAPAVIETYKGTEAGVKGALVWTPAYLDPKTWNVEAARYRINEAAGFVRHTLGANVMGLGAVMPGLTRYGTKIHQEGLITTTGHGGTVHLVAETVREVAERQQHAPRIGMLGLGSIGKSSFEVLRENADTLQARSFMVYDIDGKKVRDAVNSSRIDTPIISARSETDLINMSDIIVTAITDVIDLDFEEEKHGRKIDLTGKVIIDDSQPGCFNRQQVEARGGRLVWVVGEDTSEQQFFMREQEYAYGDASGLYGDRAVWGCEAEAGSIAMSGKYEYAINAPVTSEVARKVGRVCYETGIRVSSPLQSFGQPVDI